MSGRCLLLRAEMLDALGLGPVALEPALEAAYADKAAGRAIAPPMAYFHRDGAKWANAMLSWSPGLGALGCKFQAGDPGGPARGLPGVRGYFLLADDDTGALVAMIDARWLTAMRTVATSLLVARRLAPPGARTLGLIGCGLQARLHIAALRAAVPGLGRVRAYDRVPGRAAALAAALDRRHALSVEACDSAEGAVREADILVTSAYIEPARRPVIEADWLAPGCLALVLDHDAVLTDAALRAFDRHLTDDAAQFAHAQAQEGAFAALPRIDAEVAQLVAGSFPPRRDASERIAALRLGLGLEDLAVAVATHRAAVAAGAGTLLPL